MPSFDLPFDLDFLIRLKQACEYKWCVRKSKKSDVERLPKSAVKRGKGMRMVVKKGQEVEATTWEDEEAEEEMANKDKVSKVVKRGKRTKSVVGRGKGTKVVVKEGQGVAATADKEMVNKDKVGKNIHPWQRRTMGGSFSGEVMLEYGGEDLGEKSGRVAWRDPDDIKQEELTCSVLQPTKGRGIKKRKPPTKYVECSCVEGEEGEKVDESMAEEVSNAATHRLARDTSSVEEEVIEVSVSIREDAIKEEAPLEIVEEQVNILMMVKKAKERMVERNEKIKRLGADEEMKGAYLVNLKSEETEDMKRLEENARARMELEREDQEIRRKARERDIEVMMVKQALEEKARQKAKQKAELKKELEALKEFDNSVKEMDAVKELMESLPSSADVAH